MIDIMTVEYDASGACPTGHIAQLSGDRQVSRATDPSNHLVGVFRAPGAAATDARVAVGRVGIYPVKYGASVVRGALLTVDADGKAVTAAQGNRVVGVAEVSGSADDLGEALITLGIV